MVTKGQKEIERQENARKLILTFLKCIHDEFHNTCVFALLKNRNHRDYPVNASYIRVNEKELKKSLATDSKIR